MNENKITLRSAGLSESNSHCGDAAVIPGESKRHDFHLIESLRSDRRVLEGSPDLEKGTFGLVRAARIDNDKPI